MSNGSFSEMRHRFRAHARSSDSGERGFVIIKSLFVLVAVLALAGLAADLGSLFRTRIRLERVVRGAVLVGTGFRALNGWQYLYGGEPNYGSNGEIEPPGSSNRLAEATQHMTRAVESNVLASRMEVARIQSVEGSYDILQDRAELTVRYRQPLWLLPWLVGRNIQELVVTSSAQLRPANIVLVLDTSQSMGCPNDDPGCTCRQTNSCGSNANQPKQLVTHLKAATHEFRKFFNPGRDRLGLVNFNLAANPQRVPIRTTGNLTSFGATEVRHTSFKSFIDNLDTATSTNHCDGLLSAIDELDGVADSPIVLMFTDGAATGGRFDFTDPFGTPSRIPPGQDDWYLYTVEWWDEATSSAQHGPSPLIRKTDALYNHDPSELGNVMPTGGQSCGDVIDDQSAMPSVLLGEGGGNGCLKSFEFKLPGLTDESTNPKVGKEIGDVAAEWRYYPQLFYHCTIQAADYFRRNGGLMYVVGFGNAAPQVSDDPYQDIADSFRRKDIYLARVALDAQAVEDETEGRGFRGRRTITVPGGADHGSAGQSIDIGYDDAASASALITEDNEGVYLSTNDANEIKPIFTYVAKSLLLRLLS
jgi:hypothetical protein